jgi:rRNA-processing protein FCF1
MKVILDTNFLIYCIHERIDYVEELAKLLNENYEIVVPLQVVNELEKLKNDKFKKVSGKDKIACDLALQLLKHNNVKEVEVQGDSVDEGIINLAKMNKKNVICTLDRGMRKQLSRVILLNKNKELILAK